MAFFHLHAKIIGRSQGRHAVAAAAYRCGIRLSCQQSGQIFDYRRKNDVIRSGILAPTILAPSWAPDWVDDRQVLYNFVEASETRKDAQLLREFDLAIPKELDDEASKLLVLRWNRENFLIHELVSDVAFHRGYREENRHAHVLVTLRRIECEGFAARKAVELNHPSMCARWRESWERYCNEALQRAGVEERVSRLSLEAQGINRMPQRHVGQAVTAMRRRGALSEEAYKRFRYRLEATHENPSQGGYIDFLNAWRHLSGRHRLDATVGSRLHRLDGPTGPGAQPDRGVS